MADSSNTVNVRIAVPAVDLSGIDALIRRGDALSASMDTLRHSMRETGKHLGTLPAFTGAAPTQAGGVPAGPGTAPTAASLQTQIQALKLQQAEIDQAGAPQLFREVETKRRDLERQLQRLTLHETARQREQAADAQGRPALPSVPPVPVLPEARPAPLALPEAPPTPAQPPAPPVTVLPEARPAPLALPEAPPAPAQPPAPPVTVLPEARPAPLALPEAPPAPAQPPAPPVTAEPPVAAPPRLTLSQRYATFVEEEAQRTAAAAQPAVTERPPAPVPPPVVARPPVIERPPVAAAPPAPAPPPVAERPPAPVPPAVVAPPVVAPPAVAGRPAVAAPPAAQPAARPAVTPQPAARPGAAPAAAQPGAQPGAAPPAAQPAAAPAPMTQRDAWRQRMQLAATEHRLANVQAQRARVQPHQTQRAERLEREEARLQARAQTLTGAIQAGQAAPPPEPAEAEDGGGGGRPPRRPPRPPQEPGDRMWSMTRRGASVLGTAIIGGTIGGLAAQGISMIASPLIDRARVAMERYEQRVRGVGQLSQLLVTDYDKINTRLDTMRENYSLLASEGLDVMQGIAQHMGSEGGGLGAARFARAYGVAPGMAGEMQGRYQRLIAPYGPETQTPLGRLARAQVRGRAGSPDITDLQFVEQALGVAGVGGTSVPTPSGDVVGRMTDFLGSLGWRFPGQQANVYQQFAQGLSTPAAEPMQALRVRAVSRLADRLPGGILTVGKGKDAEKIDLRTMEGIQQALELAPQSPEVMEAMAREAQEAGGGYPELERFMFRGIVTPGMGVTVGNRIYRRRAELGRRGFEALNEPLPFREGEEVDPRLRLQEPVYQKMLETSAKLESELQGIGKTLVESKLVFDQGLAKLAEFGNTVVKQGFDDVKNALRTGDETLKRMDEGVKDSSMTLKDIFNLWLQSGAFAGGNEFGGPTPPPGTWHPPMLPPDRTTPQKPQ